MQQRHLAYKRFFDMLFPKGFNGPYDPLASEHVSWWRSSLLGYPCAVLFVASSFLLSWLEVEWYIHDYFLGSVVVLGTFLVAWIWGTGPAFLALILGVLGADYWIVPPIKEIGFYKWPDIASFLPFIIIQLLIFYSISRQKHSQRQLSQAERIATRQARELEESNLRLKQADHIKDVFLSMAAHELRTPITIIHGFLQVTIRTIQKQKGLMPALSSIGDALIRVDLKVKELAMLVNDLLEISNLRSGVIPIKDGLCNINELMIKIIEEQRLFSPSPLEFKLPTKPLFVQGDPVRLSQVVTNLLMNAFKYSPAGKVIIVRVEHKPAVVQISVQDYGKGIAPQEVESIFTPFYRGAESEALEVGGSGLGLSIAQEIVTRHQGRIWCESTLGIGTTFIVQLPLVSQQKNLLSTSEEQEQDDG